jgi:cell division protein FtsI (penicillin-binding protein 3)
LACVGKTPEPKSVVPSSAEAARAKSDAPRPAEATVESTANREISRLVDEERARTVAELGAKGGVVIVADAKSHTVLAASGDVDTPRVPGSTVKPILVAAALEAGVVDEKTSLDCGNGFRMYGARKLADASPHGALDLASVLAVSSNVGASRVADSLGRERTLRAFASVGLGAGIPSKVDDGFELAVVASGEGMSATPRALVAAYGALVDGTFEGREVLRPATAARVRSMLEEVVYAKEGTGGRAAVPSVRVAGKTGTSRNGPDLYSSFVGFLPASEPRYVIYVGVDAPRDEAPGGKAAAPVFARIATRLLAR